jgi:hypothetical protein
MIADNLDIGRTANAEIIFGGKIRRDTPAHGPGRRSVPGVLAAEGVTNKSLSARTRLSPIA